jgi:hypothetical protein
VPTQKTSNAGEGDRDNSSKGSQGGRAPHGGNRSSSLLGDLNDAAVRIRSAAEDVGLIDDLRAVGDDFQQIIKRLTKRETEGGETQRRTNTTAPVPTDSVTPARASESKRSKKSPPNEK